MNGSQNPKGQGDLPKCTVCTVHQCIITNPFHLTGNEKLIVLSRYLMHFLYFEVLLSLIVTYLEQDVNIMWQS